MATSVKGTNTGVAFVRQELVDILSKYDLIEDCISLGIKDKGEKYLPKFVPTNDVQGDEVRYNGYIERAVFYEVTLETLKGLRGQVYANDPVIKLPSLLKPLEEDANGNGISLVQNSAEAFTATLAYGRCGLYIDYPITNGVAVSLLAAQQGDIKPTINVYSPKSIINWRTKRRGAKHVYELVVFAETEQVVLEDGFTIEQRDRRKVLRLLDDIYVIEIYNSDGGGFPTTPNETLTPQDANGKFFDTIPFTFIGAETNDETIDAPPMHGLATLNLGHYRNSADYEEACFVVGQPTYVVTGLDEKWYEEILGRKISVGSRGGIPLPKDADAKILQVEPNTMAKEAMEHKEKQMVAIGAKLVEQQDVQQTATQANINNTSKTSQLANVANNVSAAFTYALKVAAQFAGAGDAEIEFALNTEFAINRLSPEEQTQLIAQWQAHAITFSEMRRALKDSAIATLSDEEAKAELKKEAEETGDQAASDAKKLAEAVPPAPVGV